MENFIVKKIDRDIVNECVDVFIDTFTKEPWYDVYESKDKVVKYFNNYLDNNCFLGYVCLLDEKVVAMSIGMKKSSIEGMEYYIDEFCISYKLQGKGIGSKFMKYIKEDIQKQELNGMLLNTKKNYPAYKFYLKNGFKQIDDLVVLGI